MTIKLALISSRPTVTLTKGQRRVLAFLQAGGTINPGSGRATMRRPGDGTRYCATVTLLQLRSMALVRWVGGRLVLTANAQRYTYPWAFGVANTRR
jgi:hypothetical protein